MVLDSKKQVPSESAPSDEFSLSQYQRMGTALEPVLQRMLEALNKAITLVSGVRHISSLTSQLSKSRPTSQQQQQQKAYHSVGIIRGNPGVFQLYPYPTLQKPLPLMRVRVLVGWGKGF
jgi:hypothetical protein